MTHVYSFQKGNKVRHYIESAHSMWYAIFESEANEVSYHHNGEKFQSTVEEFVKHHYAMVEPPRDVWKECEIYHEGAWKRNPTFDQYVDLTVEADDEEIVLQPQVQNINEYIVLQPESSS